MTARLGRLIVHAATALVPDPHARSRYREQWSADVEGAADIGMSTFSVAFGAAAAALRMAATDRHPITALTRAPLLTQVGSRPRRAFGIVQIAAAAPYLWVLALYGYARVRLGVSQAELFDTPHDPKDLLTAWVPLAWILHPISTIWLAIGGWTVGAALAPVGLILAIGGQRMARWLPLTGAVTAVAVTALAASTFGDALRTWILD